jgi:four helix bundle protein
MTDKTARTVEELLVYQRALQLADAITAILEAPAFRQDLRLRDQLRDASDSVVSNISEGFPQPTDRSFARYLYTARSSVGEIRARLQLALRRRYISDRQFKISDKLADEVARMTVGLIKHLLRSNRRDRGLGVPPDETIVQPPVEDPADPATEGRDETPD